MNEIIWYIASKFDPATLKMILWVGLNLLEQQFAMLAIIWGWLGIMEIIDKFRRF